MEVNDRLEVVGYQDDDLTLATLNDEVCINAFMDRILVHPSQSAALQRVVP